MKCRVCGNENPDWSVTCLKCNAKLYGTTNNNQNGILSSNETVEKEEVLSVDDEADTNIDAISSQDTDINQDFNNSNSLDNEIINNPVIEQQENIINEQVGSNINMDGNQVNTFNLNNNSNLENDTINEPVIEQNNNEAKSPASYFNRNNFEENKLNNSNQTDAVLNNDINLSNQDNNLTNEMASDISTNNIMNPSINNISQVNSEQQLNNSNQTDAVLNNDFNLSNQDNNLTNEMASDINSNNIMNPSVNNISQVNSEQQLNNSNQTDTTLNNDINLSNQDNNLTNEMASDISLNNITNSNSVNDNLDSKKKNGKKTIIIGLVIVILVALLALCYFLILNPSPSRIYKSLINNAYKSSQKIIDSKSDLAYMNLDITPTISGTESSDLENIVNKINISTNGAIDYKNKKLAYNLKINYNNKSLADLDLQYDKILYVFLNDLYDKPIKVDQDGMSDLFKKTDNKNISIVLNSVKNALNSSLKNDYFEKSKESNKNVITLHINESNYKKIYSSMASALLKDKKFIEAYSKEFKISKSDLKESLSEKNTNDLTANYDVIVYTEGLFNKFSEIKVKSGDTVVGIKKSNTTDTYNLYCIYNKITIGVNIKYSVEKDKKITYKSVSGAVDSSSISSETIINNFANQPGYVDLNNDIKNAIGSDISGLSQLFGDSYNSTDDEEIENYDEEDYNIEDYNY